MAKRAVVFDLDGTLVDSLADIVASFLASFASLDLAAPDEASARALVGRPLEEMYAPFAPSTAIPELVVAYRERYSAHLADTSKPFPGVIAVLEELGARGYLRLVATTKRPEMAARLVAAMGLGQYLDHVQGTQGFPAKPAPDVILRALEATASEGTWMVGDTVGDLIAGKAAGLKTYGVSWGTQDAATLATAEPDAVAKDLVSLLDLVGWPSR